MNDENITKISGLIIDPIVGKSRVVYNPNTKRYFRLGIREANFLESLLGNETLTQLKIKHNENFSVEEIEYLLNWFCQNNLLEVKSKAQQVEENNFVRKSLNYVTNPNGLRIAVVNPNKFLDKKMALVRCFFSKPALFILATLIFIPFVLLFVSPNLFIELLLNRPTNFGATQILFLYMGVMAALVLHEIAHAITCKYFGGDVEKIGIKLMYFQPVAFCDISSSWRFDKQWKKISVAAAGIVLQLLIACIAAMLSLIMNAPMILYFSLLNLALVIFNLLPIIKLDGYWILVHLMNEPNLREKSFKQFDLILKRLLGRTTEALNFELALFGILSALGTAGFIVLGLSSIYSYAAKFSSSLSLTLVAILSALLIARAAKKIFHYFKSF